MNSPFFSIVIPTFNAERTLSNAIESILVQSYSNYEILIIDAMSTDRTLELAAGFDSNLVVLVSEVDRGIYDAMNKGIRRGTGNWILFLGSDDALYSRDVLMNVSKLLSLDDDVVYGNVSRAAGFYDGEFDYRKILTKNICHQSIFFNRRVFDVVGDFNLNYKILADWDHNLRWFFSPKVRKKYINETIACYSDGGISSTKMDPLFSERRVALYLWYGKKQLSFRYRISVVYNELRMAVVHRDLRALFRGLMLAFKQI